MNYPHAVKTIAKEIEARLHAAEAEVTADGYFTGCVYSMAELFIALWSDMQKAANLKDPNLPAYQALANLMPFVLEDYMEHYATPEFKAAVEAAKAVIAFPAGATAVEGLCPLVLYFGNEADREAMIQSVSELPNIRSQSL